MAAPIEFHAEARAEFDSAFEWYAKRSVGAAIGFVSEVDAAIERIISHPNRFARTYAGCQLCRVKRYPYCVIYHRIGEMIRVVAVAHAKRRPGYWRKRQRS